MVEGLDERIVRPKKTGYKHYEIVALAKGEALHESGELLPLNEFIERLHTYPALILVKRNIADFIAELNERFKSNPHWQVHSTVREQDICLPGADFPVTHIKISTVIQWFGWYHNVFPTKNRTHHLALDPIVFTGKKLGDFWNIERTVIEELLSFGITIRDWCRENNLSPKPTVGAISAQFLTDSRFYPDCRRKVSKYENKRARDNLPGNHYQLFVADNPKDEYQAIYLDQRRAHHYHAEHTKLPNANTLYAFGRFLDLGDIFFPTVIPEFSGLYYLRIGIPETSPIRTYSPIAHEWTEESVDRFVWSNEVQLLRDLGYRIDGVIAAWGTDEPDTGLPKYAKWAQEELDHYSNPPWLKQILLATYGVLAARPRTREKIVTQTSVKNAKQVVTFTGRNELHGLLVGATGKDKRIEPRIANVLQRGLIESATRAESLGCAHYLTYKGIRVLSIYADGIIVEDEGNTSLPFLPEPWRIQNHLHHLQFINKQAFISGEVSKLPGVLDRTSYLQIAKSHRDVPVRMTYDILTGRAQKTGRHI